jgi:glycosyltransferase involved in cell wall biosynthesis
MRIGIDISQIIYGTGVSVYTKELVTNLLKIDKTDQFVLFGGSLRRKAELKKYTNKVLPLSPTVADFFWNKLHFLKVEKFIGKIDVLHSSDWTQPPTNAFKVTTVHDIAPIKFANVTSRKIVEVHQRRLYWVLREVDRIIVPTNSVKNDLIELGATPTKIRVIYEAVDEKFVKQNANIIDEVRRKFGIHDNYILTIGNGERKNTSRLIEAYQKSKKDFKLVVVGGNEKRDMDTRGIIYTGYVSDDDLIALYSGARAMVYPSLYEGFGLPILQAMACGCPLVTSNRGAMKEIAADASVLVDPMDTNSIAAGIIKAVNNPKTLSIKGLKRVKDFSWEKCAKETLDVYREANI